GLSPARILSHQRCDYFYRWCADVAMSNAGEAVFAWAMPGVDGIHVEVARMPRSGQLSTPQTLYVENPDYIFRGVAVEANAAGDPTGELVGGNGRVLYQEFARLSSGRPCQALVRRKGGAGLVGVVGLGDRARRGATMSWVTGCVGEACRPDH